MRMCGKPAYSLKTYAIHCMRAEKLSCTARPQMKDWVFATEITWHCLFPGRVIPVATQLLTANVQLKMYGVFVSCLNGSS